MGLVLVLCFSVAPISPSILLCFLMGGGMLMVFYIAAFVLTMFIPRSFLAVAFDSGGVTTGPMTAAFLLPLAQGAGGGTVLHAKGTGMEHAEKFLGFSLASEKEAVLIVVPTAKKNDIMKAVMEQAGLTTDAKAIAFSLPVTSVAGMRLMEEEQEA